MLSSDEKKKSLKFGEFALPAVFKKYPISHIEQTSLIYLYNFLHLQCDRQLRFAKILFSFDLKFAPGF